MLAAKKITPHALEPQKKYHVRIRTERGSRAHIASAASSAEACFAALDAHGDTPCGITVTPA